MKVTLGMIVSHGFPVPATFLVSYSHLQQCLLTGAGNASLPRERRIDAARVLFSYAFPIDAARNEICRLFLDHDKDSDYLLFLDTDMEHPPDLAHRLVSWGHDCVTARYVMRKAPFLTVAMRKTGTGPCDYQSVDKLLPAVTGFLPVDAGGAGALLISRRLLAAIRDHVGADDWFRYQDGPDGLRTRSEDMWFYEQARAVGVQPYLDADCICGHVAQHVVDPNWTKPFKESFDRHRALALAGVPDGPEKAEVLA